MYSENGRLTTEGSDSPGFHYFIQSWFTPSAHTLETGILQMKQMTNLQEYTLDSLLKNVFLTTAWEIQLFPFQQMWLKSLATNVFPVQTAILSSLKTSRKRERGVDLNHSVLPTHHCCPSSCSFFLRCFVLWSCQLSQVKQGWAGLVCGWETSKEHRSAHGR